MEATARYALDPTGVIASIDDGFSDLARRHGRPELARDVVGRPLTDFVAGERPRALQQALIDRARSSAGPLELRYRCDAPEMRRFAVLLIEALPDGGTAFTTWYESLQGRPRQRLLDYALARSEEVVALCAWCNRVDADGWREAEEIEPRLKAADEPPPRIEHTVCEICELLLATRPAGGPTRSAPSGLP